MKKRFVLFAVLMIMLFPLAAQEDDYDDGDEYDEDNVVFTYASYLPGDQFIRVELAACAPLNFPDFSTLFDGDAKLNIGGKAALGYHYCMTDKMFLGIDLGFGFNVSIGGHVFNYVPVTLAFTYQPVLGKWEFPLMMGIGFAWESFSNKNYFPGLVIKPGAGVHYRINQSWSAGLDVSYFCLPQFNELYNNGSNAAAHFLSVGACARYIF